MGVLRGTERGDEGLAETPRDASVDEVKAQDGPLNRPGTEAEEAAGRPGMDRGTGDTSQSS